MHVHESGSTGHHAGGVTALLAKETARVIQSLSPERERNTMRQDEIVAAHVRAQIRSGELKPGDRLPTQAEMAVALGVNKNSVFWGCAALRADGIIVSVQGGRAVVSARAVQIVADGNGRAALAEEPTEEV